MARPCRRRRVGWRPRGSDPGVRSVPRGTRCCPRRTCCATARRAGAGYRAGKRGTLAAERGDGVKALTEARQRCFRGRHFGDLAEMPRHAERRARPAFDLLHNLNGSAAVPDDAGLHPVVHKHDNVHRQSANVDSAASHGTYLGRGQLGGACGQHHERNRTCWSNHNRPPRRWCHDSRILCRSRLMGRGSALVPRRRRMNA